MVQKLTLGVLLGDLLKLGTAKHPEDVHLTLGPVLPKYIIV